MGLLTQKFYDDASEPKEFVAIDDVTHVALYDIPEYVTQAVDAMDRFFQQHAA